MKEYVKSSLTYAFKNIIKLPDFLFLETLFIPTYYFWRPNFFPGVQTSDGKPFEACNDNKQLTVALCHGFATTGLDKKVNET